ncbi:histidine phosphatase family protein [Mesorhizobium sp. M4A.F.Ca.ET.050.02.1.1]|uniref:histidine phosphatase family protein n=1 Tax=Mesorhizobium sp. M4A.F.Ca.ET.050.02.1.1 TaxID=2496754 RepID=UPI000FCCD08F|nr:histidine phosphatase family protein [Mesorhizobium sp. M4A.F.Ca.ET.050.02.1.1]RUX51750.1 histidine phosphatase family protein [Mesorhizobium sp. M4A.F.Ca.ET.050.02.1.1]
MRIVLSRHGNTFSSDETAIWVGGEANPPLVAEGKRQAWQLGTALRKAGRIPVATFCGPSKRTRTYSDIVLAACGVRQVPVEDSRLNEIDYGSWNGLSNEEVIRRFGADEFYNWYQRSIWPVSKNWKTRRRGYVKAIGCFLDDLERTYGSAKTVLVVAAHGPIKCIGRALGQEQPNFFGTQWLRVDTGNVCELDMNHGVARAIFWNKHPSCICPAADAREPKEGL